MEILKNFGFEPGLFVAQIVNFLILAYIFKRFLYKPILKTLKEREQKIKKGLDDAESAQKKLEEAEQERSEILKTASREAQKILDETKRDSKEAIAKASQDARGEAERIISEAKTQARIEIENMEKNAKRISLDISSRVLTAVMKNIFTTQEKEKILERSIKELKNYE